MHHFRQVVQPVHQFGTSAALVQFVLSWLYLGSISLPLCEHLRVSALWGSGGRQDGGFHSVLASPPPARGLGAPELGWSLQADATPGWVRGLGVRCKLPQERGTAWVPERDEQLIPLSASSALSSWESKLFGLEGSPGHTPAADLRTSMDGCGASLQPLTVHVNNPCLGRCRPAGRVHGRAETRLPCS